MSTLRTPAPALDVVRRDDGTILLRSTLPLAPVRRSLAHLFDESASAHPQRLFVRQRVAPGGPWREITYASARRQANGLAQWLIDQGATAGESVAYLSAPSIEHAVVAIGAQRAGVAIAPISVAYSLLSTDHQKLKACVQHARARFVFVDDAATYAPAMRALAPLGARFVAARGEAPGIEAVSFADVVATEPTAAVSARMNAITPESIARIMYTSGSTGAPKATPQPQSNLTITVAQTESLGLLDFEGEGPQHLEAMPFSHIMAGNFNFNNVIRAAGTIHLDDGKPTPALFARTIENLREVSPHFFITVPLGYAMLCDAMEADSALRDSFFRNLRYLAFGGAMLTESVHARLLSLSRAARGEEMPVFSFYGATEYLFGMVKYWPGGRTDVIGLPPPEAKLKLKPIGDRYELFVSTPTVMPRSGYLDAPQATAGVFDEEDYFRTGDAVAFADPADPTQGLVFAGRIADDFKLSSGTFVGANALRQDLLAACAPLLKEVVLCGLNEDWVGALVWVDERAAGSPPVEEQLREKISAFNGQQGGSSRRLGTLVCMTSPLSFDAGELTDKGNVSPNMVRSVRADAVASLFATPSPPGVLRFVKGTS